jgi:hypothetical protein
MGTNITIAGFAESKSEIEAYLFALATLNFELGKIRAGGVPHIAWSGVRFRPEPREQNRSLPEDFADAWTCCKRGWADCDDLAAWSAADMWTEGHHDARPVLISTPSRDGSRRWHAVVDTGKGQIFDPANWVLELEKAGRIRVRT